MFKSTFSMPFLADPSSHPITHCRIAFRDVTNRTNSRTVIACLTPPRVPLTNKAPYLIFSGWNTLSQSSVLGILNSIPFDWIARRYVETNLNFFILNMLNIPPSGNIPWKRIGSIAARLSCTDNRFADFAHEAGVECGPLSQEDSDQLRAQIDALVAHAYELTADELRFVFTDFTENAVPQSYRDLVVSKFEQEQSK